MQNVRAYANYVLSLLGVPGVIGIGLLLFSAGLYHAWIAPAQAEAAAIQDKAARARERAGLPATRHAAEEPLAEFYAYFPPAANVPELLQKLYELADRQGLTLPNGEYKLAAGTDERLVAYEAMLPMQGSYPQLHKFIVTVLNELPNVALDELKLERQQSTETAVDAQVRLTFFLRAS